MRDARQDEELSTQRRARLLGLGYFDTSTASQKPLYKDLLSLDELYRLKMIPLVADAHNIQFGVTNTTSQQTMNDIRHRFLDQQISFALISDTGYRDYMKLYDPPKQVVYQDISLTSASDKSTIASVSSTLEQVRADDMLAYLVKQAHKLNASDIHIENEANDVRIRLRIDGVLHPIARISKDKYRVLLSAIASAGNVSTSANDSQQGHIAQHLVMADNSQVDVNLRLETVPTTNGIDVVMRLFNMEESMYSLDKLGLSADERQVVDDIISHPSGLVLVVGPTGSGKTTTLYSMLNSLNSEERKIITIEDPVEYQLAGITQISVTSQNSQETNFAEKLRAILRLDPDIVMVGEIRDNDTAKTALQASLTGHLVLSTFHASSAAAALTRLMDVIGTNPLFVSAIRLVMAQRLVRRLDDTTKQPFTPDQETIDRLHEILSPLAASHEMPDLSQATFFRPGSSAENPYGFSGQMAIREQFIMTDQIRQTLEQTDHILSTNDIEDNAMAAGMRTMLQDGIIKASQGLTSLEEVFRVVG